ncbi:MAG: hypothetical protein QMD12_01255 [Candidatus Aenigmarchaeota archaeon]|nr:hypothetical protein [Candidatus Aenigmarchaeota archaeon]
MRSPPNYEEKENLENLKITIDSILNCGKRRFRVSDLVKASKMITTVSRFVPHLTYLVKKGYLTVEKTHKGSWYYVDELDKLRMIGWLELPNHDKKFLEKMKDTIESILYSWITGECMLDQGICHEYLE